MRATTTTTRQGRVKDDSVREETRLGEVAQAEGDTLWSWACCCSCISLEEQGSGRGRGEGEGEGVVNG